MMNLFFPYAMDIYGAKIIWTTASTVLLSNVMSYPHTHFMDAYAAASST